MTSGRIENKTDVLPDERAKTIASMEIVLRLMRKAIDCFPGDDLETILVFLTVATASTSHHLRDAAVLDLVTDEPLPDHLHRAISGRAVAEATGLPRESVRRRIDALVAQGRLAREADGVRTISGALTHNRNLEFARFLIQELSGASARLARYGAE